MSKKPGLAKFKKYFHKQSNNFHMTHSEQVPH